MRIADRIYGEFEISEDVLQALLRSPAVNRLRGIDQSGYPEPFFPGAPCTRFEHSVGVLCLLRRFGASLAEQVAGLIHDVSHTVFSHAIDYALDESSGVTQSFQDDVHESFIRSSEIPAILSKHGFDLEYILDDTHFPLKETTLPDICADRLDYSLRTALVFHRREVMELHRLVDSLEVHGERWVFCTRSFAQDYAELFREMNTFLYCNMVAGVMNMTVGRFVRHALERGYLARADLHTTDAEVLAKVKSFLAEDTELRRLFARMNNAVPFTTDRGRYDLYIRSKSRVVDPLCLVDGEARRLSEVWPAWGETVRAESQPKEYFVRFLEPN